MPEARPAEDRRRIRTREALLGAGRALFAERAVDGVSIDDIVLRAEVAKGSFYNHFADKDALAREIARQVRGEVEARVGETNAGIIDPAERLARALCVFVQFALDEPVRARVLMRLEATASRPEARYNVGLRADLENGLADRRFHGFSLQAGILVVMGTVQTTMIRAFDARGNFKGQVEEVARILLRGFGVNEEESQTIAAQEVNDVMKRRTS